MKVLFISSGKSGGVGDVVKNQGESLIKAGIELDYYIIKPGLWGYLSAISGIRRTFKQGNYDLAHAHYSFSGFAASLAGCKPLVVSLMGSDVYMSGFLRKISWLFYKHRWSSTIVKSERMKDLLKMHGAMIIPNGVDISRFKLVPKNEARDHIGYQPDNKLILFISSPSRPEKNIELAREAVKLQGDDNHELKQLWNVPNEEMSFWFNAADLLLVTSLWEGSVNVVKEALACNCSVVSTDVGDVKMLVSPVRNCYITSFDPHDVADKIKIALNGGGNNEGIEGRERIAEMGLDSENVAGRIVSVYEEVLKK